MSLEFTPYTPDVEVAEPHFAENVQTVIARMEQHITDSVIAGGASQALRDAHAKGYGLVRGEVEILDGLPNEYAQGIYATPGRHDALVRFSNGSPHTGADAHLGRSIGLALKMFDIDGPTLLEDDPDSRTFDYNTINAPVFFCNTVQHYLFIQELFFDVRAYFAEGKRGRHRFYQDYVTGKGTLKPEEWAWEEFLGFLTVSQRPLVNVLLSTYTTVGAVRHGDYIAKVRIAPDSACAAAVTERHMDVTSAAEVFRPALVAELRERPYTFDIQVQLCADLDRMPVEDLTVEWPEGLSRYVTVAKLRLPQQDISGAENLRRMDSLSFTPWRVTAAHRPLGSIMRARKEVYRWSSRLRHGLNDQELREPRSVDEALSLRASVPWTRTEMTMEAAKPNRPGLSDGRVNEFTLFFNVKPGHGALIREVFQRPEFAGHRREISWRIGTLHDMRWVLFDSDTRLMFATNFDGDWDAYIDEFAAQVPEAFDVILEHTEGYPGIKDPGIKDYIVSHQVTACSYFRALSDVTHEELQKARRVQEAFQQLLKAAAE